MKKKTFYNFILIGSILNTLISCSLFNPYKPPITQGNIIPESAVQELQTGLSKSQVQNILGPRMLKTNSNSIWQYVFYSTKKYNKELHTEQKYIQNLTLEFDKDGYLNSWHRSKGFNPAE